MNGNPLCCDNKKSAISKEIHFIESPPAGFTLLEVLIVLAVCAILAWTFQTPVTQFHKLAFTQQIVADLTMNMQRFQLLLKAELIQAGFGIPPSQIESGVDIQEHTLTLKADFNQDGDFQDTRENISYRYDVTRQRLSRKSGRGAYQRFIEGLTHLRFEAWQPSPSASINCVKIYFQVLQQTTVDEMILCPLNL